MSSPPPVLAETPTSVPVSGLDPFYDRGGDGVDLRAILDILMRGKWLILATMLALLVPVAVVSWTTPSRFRSYSILLIDKTDTDLSTKVSEVRLFQRDKKLSNEMLVINPSITVVGLVTSGAIAVVQFLRLIQVD